MSSIPLERHAAGAREALNLKQEVGYTLRLGAPLALGELGWMSTYIVDALLIGRLPHSALAISASSLGNTIFYAIVFCAISAMNGLETLVAQAYGRNERAECLRLLAQSFWFIAIGTPLVIGATLGALLVLPALGTPPDIVQETQTYLKPLVWSTAPLMGYMALRRFLQSVDQVVWVTISLVTAGAVNWFFDWTFLFGHLGAAPMGIAGSAWATVIVRAYTLLLLTVGTAIALRRFDARFQWKMLRPEISRLRVLLRIGWPSALQSLADLGVSTWMSILCARLGATLLAAHQVVLDLNAFVYQVPAGLSYATIVRVGQSAGRDNLTQVRRAANASLLLGSGFMVCASTLFAAFSHLWASLYTNDENVVIAAMPIFTLCAFLLVGDAVGVVIASALTGLGDTRTPMIVSLIWSWAIGMPLGYVLAFQQGFALRGLWLGRAVAAVGSGATLFLLWRARLHRLQHAGRGPAINMLSAIQVPR